MKKHVFFALISLLPLSAWSQNHLSLSGGYSFATVEDSGTPLSGWRINGLYESATQEGKFLHGISIGYISVTGSNTTTILSVPYKEDISVGTIPVYYAPKWLFGKSEKFKPYVHLAIGGQFSTIKRTTSLATATATDFGFYGGGGAGFQLNMKNDLFLNLEYELVWLSNSFYKDGGMNTASLGIGKKF